eukprot:m.192230 g.192230  ORF g.192230 m.192230 type:complete len:255 (-) comp21734_c0_seq5:34-798(-)
MAVVGACGNRKEASVMGRGEVPFFFFWNPSKNFRLPCTTVGCISQRQPTRAMDLDALLDEAESMLQVQGEKAPSARSAVKTPAAQPKPKPAASTAAVDDVDDLLRDLELPHHLKHDRKQQASGSAPATASLSPITSPSSVCSSAQQRTIKCMPLLLGGCSLDLGANRGTSKCACSSLRCTSCDFKVCCFDNQRWAEDSDYLFFRNNMPEKDKLKAKLETAPGTRAYSCQCSWRSIDSETRVDADPALKWVCAKH